MSTFDEARSAGGSSMSDPAGAAGCAESRLAMTRRGVLGLSVGLYSWAFMPKFAEAASKGNDPRLLIVVLRGGMDGLSVVVPHGDKHYVSHRGELVIPKGVTQKLDSDFGLHPALKKFGELYRKKEAAVVHATCVPLHNRSHFDALDNLENGMPGLAANTTGWLNRVLSSLPKGSPVLKQGAIQIGAAPLILHGPAPVLGWSPNSYADMDPTTEYLIRTLYRENDRQMYKFLERGLKADALAEKVDQDDTGVSSLRRGFRGAGRLLKANSGPRIAVLSVSGWDTHADQGAETGALAGLLEELDLAIGDFKKEAGKAWDETVMVCATEFGRTVRTNGDEGTDHGVGTVVLLAGGKVKGGKVHGDWPGLAPAKLYDGSDLKPTTDLRAVFKGVLRDHLDMPKSILNSAIFPESRKVDAMKGLVVSGKTRADPAEDAPDGLYAREVAMRPDSAIARYRRGEQVAETYAPSMIDSLPDLPLSPN